MGGGSLEDRKLGQRNSDLRIGLDQVNRLTSRKHNLSQKAKPTELNQLLCRTCGLHATGAVNPYLALFARVQGFKREDLERALFRDRCAARIRCLRKTIFIHHISLVPIYFAASAQALIPASEDYMHRSGISAGLAQKLTGEILRLLEGRELSAAEITSKLGFEGNLSPLLYYLCDSGDLVRGRPVAGWRDKRVRYAIFAEWFPELDLTEWEESQARVEVVRRYLQAFGPVSLEDVLWWTGFGKRATRAALNQLKAELIPVHVDQLDHVCWLHQDDREVVEGESKGESGTINLLPNLDPYLMGYKLRERYLEPAFSPYVFDRAGNITSTILLDGRVIGVWDVARDGEAELKLHFFRDPGADVRNAVCEQAGRLGAFLTDRVPGIRICKRMQPLTERSMGGMMSPLKGG